MTTAFTAKLYIASVERQASNPDTVKVKFGAVTRGEANKAWAEATPMASFEMTVQNPEVVPALRMGQEFYVHFEPAEEVTSLADGHEYTPGDYETKNPHPTYGEANFRCTLCNCKRVSHVEPLRSRIVAAAGL